MPNYTVQLNADKTVATLVLDPADAKLQRTKEWASQRYGIKPEEVAWYHSGICYSRIGVTTEDAAEKVKAKVQSQGRTANGGMLDGMPLGGYLKGQDGIYDVYV